MNNAAETPLRARQARKARGWTQQDVADKAGVTLRTYQAFETGAAHPQRANLLAFIDVLGLDDDVADLEPRWDADTSAFLNMLGVYMEGLSDRERRLFIEVETRRIFEHARSSRDEVEAADPEVDPAVYEAMRTVGRLSKSRPRSPVTGQDH